MLGGCNLWYKLDISTFVIDGKRLKPRWNWSSQAYSCCQNPKFGEFLDIPTQHKADYVINRSGK